MLIASLNVLGKNLLTQINKEKVVLLYPMAIFAVMGLSLFSTIHAYISYPTCEITTGALLGILARFVWVLLFLLIMGCLDEEKKQSLLTTCVTTLVIMNLFACVIQLTFGHPEIFYSLYYSDVQTPLKIPLQMGYFLRGYGLFPSPVNLGPFVLTSLAIALIYKKPILILLCGILSAISMSKTAIVGFPLLVFIYFIYKNLFCKNAKCRITAYGRFKIAFVLLAIILGMTGATLLMIKANPVSKYYYTVFTNPARVFSSRYDPSSESFIASDTIESIRENFFLGTGYTKIRNEFIGDSTYIVMLKEAGFIGLLIYLLSILMIILYLFKKRNAAVLIPFSMLANGVGSSAFLSLYDIAVLLIVLLSCQDVPYKRNFNLCRHKTIELSQNGL